MADRGRQQACAHALMRICMQRMQACDGYHRQTRPWTTIGQGNKMWQWQWYLDTWNKARSLMYV